MTSEPIPAFLEDRSHPMAPAVSHLSGLFRYRELLRNLVARDLKLKYRGSMFGFTWSLVNPVVMIAVYSTAFTFILRVRIENFVFFLLLGVLAWTFFANSATMSTGSVADSGGLVKAVYFPRAILPLATVLFNLAQYLLTILVLLPLMLVLFRVAPSASMILFPVFLTLQVLFTIGIALLVSAGTVFFRDIRHFVDIALGILFWTTPIVYQYRDVPDTLRPLILLSPISSFVLAYQEIFYYRTWPDPSLWLVATTYAVVALVSGGAVFVACESRFAEHV